MIEAAESTIERFRRESKMMKKVSGRTTYFSVGTDAVNSAKDGPFRVFRLPDGARVRVMEKRVFDRAVDGADQKLREVLDKPKKSEFAS